MAALRKTWDTELKVGAFILAGLILTLIAIIVLGSTESMLTRRNTYHSHFADVESLIGGAKVVMGGMQVGTVKSVEYSSEHRDILVEFEVARDEADWIRKDSTVQILTQGVLGDKYIEISRGADDQPIVPPGQEIPNSTGAGLSQFLSKGDQLMVTLQSIAGSMDRLFRNFEAGHRSEFFFDGMAKTAQHLATASERLNEEIADIHLKAASKNLNAILAKINDGTGTIGALVNDPGLYYDVKALMGGANRNRIVRNLVRQTIKDGEKGGSSKPQGPAKTPQQ